MGTTGGMQKGRVIKKSDYRGYCPGAIQAKKEGRKVNKKGELQEKRQAEIEKLRDIICSREGRKAPIKRKRLLGEGGHLLKENPGA